MPTYVIVNDADGTFRVHRQNCGDYRRRPSNNDWTCVAPSADDAVRLEREDLRNDFGDNADDFEFVVLPCTKEAK